MIRKLLHSFASLRLTVLLLALTMLLVFAGTSIQKELGIWDVQRLFFHSFFAWIDLRLLFPLWSWGYAHVPGKIPMLGGYSLITLMLLNLIAAHSVRFALNRKRIGIILIHSGLILLLLGEVVTSLFAVEGRMIIDEGQTVSFSQNIRKPELVIIDPSASDDFDNVMAIPLSLLSPGKTIADPKLPFDVQVDSYFANSAILGPFQIAQMGRQPDARATAGMGVGVTVIEQPGVSGIDDQIDTPSAYITLSKNNHSLGTYLVTPQLDQPQEVMIGDKTYQIALRWKRDYKPYSLTLVRFSHDKYTGSETPRNYSSLVRISDPSRNEDREVKIWMNHPFRYAGETFYQQSFLPNDKTTILQVVHNPGWLIPYISCVLVALGLLIHFGTHLLKFLSRSRTNVTTNSPGARYTLKPQTGGVLWPGIVCGFCLLYLLAAGRAPKHDSPFDLNAFGHIPISFEGRVMPLDSLARVSLRILSNKSDLHTDGGKTVPAIHWLADVMANVPATHEQKIFRIDQPEVVSFLGLNPDRTTFSLAEIVPKLSDLDEQFNRIRDIPAKRRDTFQTKLFELTMHLDLFMRLAQGQSLYFAPPMNVGDDWKTLATAAEEMNAKNPGSTINPGLAAYVAMMQSYLQNQPEDFNRTLDEYLPYISRNLPEVAQRANFEVLFNYFDPFINCMALYVLAFLFICASWLIAPARSTLQRTANWILLLTFAFHTLGLVARIYIQGRPPVTNLYSSAIFIGWGAVLFCLVLERLYRNGIGSLVASVIAFPTLVIAHYLAGSGDTMQMLQAVLDTNIWLATHVVVVTLGYMATFLAGILACVYIIGNVCFGAFSDDHSRRTMTRMTYGIVCFALLFSFVGTVLGGIWADQSWGRFWGWDPKENGAVLIVLWNAIVLHARWGGLVREHRGMMSLIVFGNIVTAWSWFGTNMMGVGLHSYGFMDSAVSWLAAFVASQITVIAVAALVSNANTTPCPPSQPPRRPTRAVARV